MKFKFVLAAFALLLAVSAAFATIRSPFTFQYVTEDANFYYVGVDATNLIEDVDYECIQTAPACRVISDVLPDAQGRIPKNQAQKDGVLKQFHLLP